MVNTRRVMSESGADGQAHGGRSRPWHSEARRGLLAHSNGAWDPVYRRRAQPRGCVEEPRLQSWPSWDTAESHSPCKDVVRDSSVIRREKWNTVHTLYILSFLKVFFFKFFENM